MDTKWTTCSVCGRVLSARSKWLTVGMHEKCWLRRCAREADAALRNKHAELTHLQDAVRSAYEVLNRYNFMRMFFIRVFNVDILPEEPRKPYGADCIMLEREWNPANEEQAEGRLTRKPYAH